MKFYIQIMLERFSTVAPFKVWEVLPISTESCYFPPWLVSFLKRKDRHSSLVSKGNFDVVDLKGYPLLVLFSACLI